jgi:hypothetical protein
MHFFIFIFVAGYAANINHVLYEMLQHGSE